MPRESVQKQFNPPKVLKNVYDYTVKELGPLRIEVFQFWDEVVSVKVSLREALFGRRIDELTIRHQDLLKRWVKAREKTVRMEAFISVDDPDGVQKIAEIMKELAIWRHVKENETDFSAVIRDITDTLRGLRMESDSKRTGFLAAFATILALASIVVSVLIDIF